MDNKTYRNMREQTIVMNSFSSAYKSVPILDGKKCLHGGYEINHLFFLLGSVYFLKGFQVIQTGSEMINFRSQQCAVIDISNITLDQFTKLPGVSPFFHLSVVAMYNIEP